jgi:hypothetical protein
VLCPRNRHLPTHPHPNSINSIIVITSIEFSSIIIMEEQAVEAEEVDMEEQDTNSRNSPLYRRRQWRYRRGK